MALNGFAAATAIADAFNRAYQSSHPERPNAEVLADLAVAVGQILEDADVASRTGFLAAAGIGGLLVPER